jgi:hypothetical protein
LAILKKRLHKFFNLLGFVSSRPSIEQMTSAAFDTLQFAKKAEQAGFTKQQAEFQAEALAEIFNEKMATKGDLKKEIRDSEERIIAKLTIRFGYMLAGAVVILPVIFKLINLI